MSSTPGRRSATTSFLSVERCSGGCVTITMLVTAIHLVSQGGQQSVSEHVLYLALPLGFSLLAVGLLLWTGSLWAAVGVHGGFHIGNYIAEAAMPEADAVSSWLAIGGAQVAVGIVLTVSALRRGGTVPGSSPVRRSAPWR